MNKDSKIYIAGHRGMVGSAIMRELQREGYTNLITRTHSELDLTRQTEVERFFAEEKPEYVFLAAAKVGGISQPVGTGRFHVRQHDAGDERDTRSLEKRMQETLVPGFQLHLSPTGTPTYAGIVSAHR